MYAIRLSKVESLRKDEEREQAEDRAKSRNKDAIEFAW
ncbi:hypothetical protein TMEN_561 [Trichophyton mentagrophytes]|nr:hypothetical protein TMEN_561 [Trichophyton mentagrophytes]